MVVKKDTVVVSNCVHHWMIEPASGGDSKGKCVKCKMVKKFSNSGGGDTSLAWGNSPNSKLTKKEGEE